MSTFGDNVTRLMGMHRIKAQEAGVLLGVSPTAVSEWKRNLRGPQLQTALKVGEFFDVPAMELVQADFPTLLAAGAGDPDRFARVEEKIARLRDGSPRVASRRRT